MAPNYLKNFRKKQQDDSKVLREIGPYMNLGWQLVITIALCALLGWWLDKVLHTAPILLIILTFFGAFAGMFTFIRTVLRLDKERKEGK